MIVKGSLFKKYKLKLYIIFISSIVIYQFIKIFLSYFVIESLNKVRGDFAIIIN